MSYPGKVRAADRRLGRVDRDPEQLRLQHDHGEPGRLAGGGVVEPDRDRDHRLPGDNRRLRATDGCGGPISTLAAAAGRRSAPSRARRTPGPPPGRARCPRRRAVRSGRRWTRRPGRPRTPRRTGSPGWARPRAAATPRRHPGAPHGARRAGSGRRSCRPSDPAACRARPRPRRGSSSRPGWPGTAARRAAGGPGTGGPDRRARRRSRSGRRCISWPARCAGATASPVRGARARPPSGRPAPWWPGPVRALRPCPRHPAAATPRRAARPTAGDRIVTSGGASGHPAHRDRAASRPITTGSGGGSPERRSPHGRCAFSASNDNLPSPVLGRRADGHPACPRPLIFTPDEQN